MTTGKTVDRLQAALIIAVLLTGAPALAQRASITGRVTDSSGAVVAGARVTATGAATGVASTSVTNAEGYYSIPYLPPGVYNVQIELRGFQPAVQSGITLETGQVARIDTVLQVGVVTESIDVTARPAVLDTETGSVGQMVDSKTISELPVPGGGIFGMVMLAGEPTTGAATAITDPPRAWARRWR